jgi:N-acetyl-anhydromuramyl-L-alanine amidase AmpD
VGACNNAPGAVSAHFAICGDGTLVQIVPTSRIAWAQGGQSDRYSVSVEIENRELPTNQVQLTSARILFGWAAETNGFPRHGTRAGHQRDHAVGAPPCPGSK